MAHAERTPNRVKAKRLQCGWSQLELAERSGVSRTAVSAIEGERLCPSVAAALSLARAFGCSVEDLFGLPGDPGGEAVWAWSPTCEPCRFWAAEVGGRTVLFPAEATGHGVVPHDGIFTQGRSHDRGHRPPNETLVVACCDPAAGLLATHFARASGFRLLVLPRSSQRALGLLAEGLVHLAGVHLATKDCPDRNARAVQEKLGQGYRLLRVARWQEGVAIAPGLTARTVGAALRSRLRWVGREAGSGARQCLDELLAERQHPRRLAHDHRGVAEAIRCGWADAGVCLRLACEEAGLRFLCVREEAYDLCYTASAESDPRIRALLSVLRSPDFRQTLGELPGYDVSETGEVQQVA